MSYIGQTYLKEAVANGFALVLFDFAGSGNSEGEYISLGTRRLIQRRVLRVSGYSDGCWPSEKGESGDGYCAVG
jgi:predicted acyl esterase